VLEAALLKRTPLEHRLQDCDMIRNVLLLFATFIEMIEQKW
jgi:hypothetical protein